MFWGENCEHRKIGQKIYITELFNPANVGTSDILRDHGHFSLSDVIASTFCRNVFEFISIIFIFIFFRTLTTDSCGSFAAEFVSRAFVPSSCPRSRIAQNLHVVACIITQYYVLPHIATRDHGGSRRINEDQGESRTLTRRITKDHRVVRSITEYCSISLSIPYHMVSRAVTQYHAVFRKITQNSVASFHYLPYHVSITSASHVSSRVDKLPRRHHPSRSNFARTSPPSL